LANRSYLLQLRQVKVAVQWAMVEAVITYQRVESGNALCRAIEVSATIGCTNTKHACSHSRIIFDQSRRIVSIIFDQSRHQIHHCFYGQQHTASGRLPCVSFLEVRDGLQIWQIDCTKLFGSSENPQVNNFVSVPVHAIAIVSTNLYACTVPLQ